MDILLEEAKLPGLAYDLRFAHETPALLRGTLLFCRARCEDQRAFERHLGGTQGQVTKETGGESAGPTEGRAAPVGEDFGNPLVLAVTPPPFPGSFSEVSTVRVSSTRVAFLLPGGAEARVASEGPRCAWRTAPGVRLCAGNIDTHPSLAHRRPSPGQLELAASTESREASSHPCFCHPRAGTQASGSRHLPPGKAACEPPAQPPSQGALRAVSLPAAACGVSCTISVPGADGRERQGGAYPGRSRAA